MRYVCVFVVALAAALPAATHGMNWSDSGQCFHFAGRILRGDFPYRDFSYQSGFLGLFLHAAAMKVFGMQALVAVMVRLVAAALGVVAMAALFERSGSRFAATTVGLGAGILLPAVFPELLYSGGNEVWAILFGLAGGALLAAAAKAAEEGRSPGRPALLAGLLVSLVLGARQGEGIVLAGVIAGVAALLLVGGGLRPRARFAATLTAGVAVGWGLLVAVLAAGSALEPGLKELLLSAAEKKDVAPARSVAYALLGGLPWCGERTVPLVVIPGLGALASFLAFAWPGRLPPGARVAGLLLMPALVLTGVLLFPFRSTHTLGVALLNHPTRIFLTLAAAWLCIVVLRRMSTPIPAGSLLIAIAVPLALVWGHGLSFAGVEDTPRYLLAVPCVALACVDPRVSRPFRRATGF
ncbi:MAG TPA: hypothetical protein VKU85_12265, partial [bacterium]|nr:hypothetical protein [bacterium]